MKVLNLYSGIGGNRKMWKDVQVTAVEYNQEIADIYKEYFPDDTVIVADAHEYLLKHYKEYDFIWSSPPCPTHSRLQTTIVGRGEEPVYPDLALYQEIIFLKQWFKGKYVVENVIPYYEPLIPGKLIHRHLFWTNIPVRDIEIQDKKVPHEQAGIKDLEKCYGYDLSKYKLDSYTKRKVLRNCVHPEVGLYILEQAQGIMRIEKTDQLKLAI